MYKIKQNKKSKFNSQQQQKRALLYDSERNCAKDSQVMILSKKGEYQFHSASPDMSGVFKTSLTVGSRGIVGIQWFLHKPQRLAHPVKQQWFGIVFCKQVTDSPIQEPCN